MNYKYFYVYPQHRQNNTNANNVVDLYEDEQKNFITDINIVKIQFFCNTLSLDFFYHNRMKIIYF